MLKLNNIEVNYLNVILILKGVSLEVSEGSIVALLRGNGAGKQKTYLRIVNGKLVS
jgi:branched-chain amino acid transport system ATP-binding protein